MLMDIIESLTYFLAENRSTIMIIMYAVGNSLIFWTIRLKKILKKQKEILDRNDKR